MEETLATNSLNASLILSVDATNTIESSFVEKAIQYFGDPLVAAVYGRLHSFLLGCYKPMESSSSLQGISGCWGERRNRYAHHLWDANAKILMHKSRWL